MATQDIAIRTPWGLEGDLKSINPKQANIPIPVPDVPEVPKIPESNVLDKIFSDAAKYSKKSTVDPFASKFQDASLSERYKGREVFYGDYKLDPKLLDARYSKTQSWGEQSLNNLQIGLVNGGAMFASGMLALPDIIKNIATGQDLSKSSVTDSLFNMREEFANNNINFQNEQDNKTDAWNTIKNTLLPSFLSGSTTGWGSIFENAMYGVGAGASIATQEALVSLIAPGIGNSAVLSTNVAKVLNNLESIRKYSTLADRIIDTSTTLAQATKALNQGNRLVDASKWAYRATIGAYGEAGFEGEEARHSLKKTLTQQFKDKNGYEPVGKDLENINKLSDEGASARFWANMTLLMGTNTFQLKRLFRNIDIAKDSAEQIARQGLKIELNETGQAVAKNAFEFKSSWWNNGFGKYIKKPAELIGGKLNTDFVKESVSEGLEEFTQTGIEKSVNNYYSWKLDHRGAPSFDQAIKSTMDGFSESWSTEGLRAFLSGAVAGVAQQAAFSLPNARKQLQVKDKYKQELNEALAEYNNFDVNDFFKAANINSLRGTISDKALALNSSAVADKVADIATDNNDKKIYKDIESLSFFELARPYVSKGHSQILKDQFEFSLENLSDEQVQDMFGNSSLTKDEAIKEFNTKVNNINDSYSKIKQAFRNPYHWSQPQYNIFEEQFLPELSYLDYRSKDLTKRASQIQETLGDYYNDFKYFSDSSTLNKGKSYVAGEIKRLKETEEYLKLLGSDPVITEEFNKSKYLVDTYEQSLKELEDFEKDPSQENYEKFLNTYHEAFISKYDRDEKGFFNREEVMSKISDFNRITGDLKSIEESLKSYFAPNGEQFFIETFEAAARREQRKRELYNLNQELIDLKPQLIEEYPDLTEAQIEEVLLNSNNVAQAKTNIEKAALKIREENAKITEIKEQIRSKFISADRADLVEDYLSNLSISSSNKDKILSNADEYLKTINNKEFSDFKEARHKDFIEEIQKLNSGFVNTGLLQELENQTSYEVLDRSEKIKYHNALIKYYTQLKSFKGLPKEYIKKQDELINQQKELIKNLPEEKEVFSEQVGDYLIVKDDNNKYNLSKNNKYVGSFDTLQDAKKKIESDLNELQKKNDTKADDINNLENKFENGYYDPKTFDKDGNRIVSPEQALKNRTIKAVLFHDIANARTEDQVADAIKENLVIDKYSVENRPDAERIYVPDGENSGQLIQEPILRSVTTDAIVLSYKHESGNIPLQTIKHPLNGLAFVGEKPLREELGKKIKSVDEIVSFIGNSTYYEFLQKSVVDDKVYKTLQANNFIRFKGTVQEQINLLTSKKKIWDKLNSGNIQDLSFKRLFNSINYGDGKKVVLGNHMIDEITYPFALLKGEDGKEYNNYAFFYVPNNFEASKAAEAKISFIGLDPEFHKDANSKVVSSFTKRFATDVNVFSGYYMLITDSSGNPVTYKLKNQDITSEQFFDESIQGRDFKQVMVVSDNPNIDISFSVKSEGTFINIGDKSDSSVLSFKHPISSIKDVDQIIPQIYSQLSKPQNWGGIKNTKSFRTDSLGLSLARKSNFEPTTAQQIMSSRMVTGIHPNNFMVNKLDIQEINDEVVNVDISPLPEVKKEVIKPTPPVVKDAFSSASVAKSLGIKIPNTITYTQVDDFINNLPNLQTTKEKIAEAIVLGAHIRMQIEETPVYLNSVENIDEEVLQRVSAQPLNIINNVFVKNNVGNLFTTKIPYKTNVADTSVQKRVDSLLKNCFK